MTDFNCKFKLQKGIITDVVLGGEVLTDWTTCLTNNFVPNFQNSKFMDVLEKYKTPDFEISADKNSGIDFNVPAVYFGEFPVIQNISSFLKMDKFTKGVALIGAQGKKSTNLGRYWPATGPQVTLYTPGAFIEPNANNQIALIEFEGSSCANPIDCYVEFIDYPIIDSI
jgi:beta-galactosidase